MLSVGLPTFWCQQSCALRVEAIHVKIPLHPTPFSRKLDKPIFVSALIGLTL